MESDKTKNTYCGRCEKKVDDHTSTTNQHLCPVNIQKEAEAQKKNKREWLQKK